MRQETDPVDALNTLLRGEISAVETYRQALKKVDDFQARTQLEECERSHQRRVGKLTDRVRALGGKPAETSGMWGAFAKLIEGGARLLGTRAAVIALEQGEDRGLKDYRTEIEKLDPDSRRMVENELLPDATLSTLQKTIH